MIHLGNQTSVLSLSFVFTAPWSPSLHATNWPLSCEELRVDYNSHSSSPFVRWKYVSFGAEGSCRTDMKDSKVCIGWISKQTTAGFCQTMRRVHNLCFSHWTFRLKLEQTSKANNFFRAVIFSPWCWSSCRVSTLITLSAEPESINTSLLTPPEITGLAEVDKTHVWSGFYSNSKCLIVTWLLRKTLGKFGLSAFATASIWPHLWRDMRMTCPIQNSTYHCIRARLEMSDINTVFNLALQCYCLRLLTCLLCHAATKSFWTIFTSCIVLHFNSTSSWRILVLSKVTLFTVTMSWNTFYKVFYFLFFIFIYQQY